MALLPQLIFATKSWRRAATPPARGGAPTPAEMTVREIMSGPIITGNPDWTLMECSQVMQEHHIHHLPIADENGALIGLISATDIFMAVEEAGWEAQEE